MTVQLAPSERRRIIVLGYLVRGPVGGGAWQNLQYVLGFARLGHDVWYLEDSDDEHAPCYDPRVDAWTADPTYGLDFTHRAFTRLGLGDRWAYFDSVPQHWRGPAAADIHHVCESADVVLNISGVNPLRPWLVDVPARALVGTDPAFDQIRNLTIPDRQERSALHTSFFTYGTAIGSPQYDVPDDGFRWQPTRQPVVLDAWPVVDPPTRSMFTTVMQWGSYASLEYEGHHYGMKDESFDAVLDLPSRAGAVFDLAIGSPHVPRVLLREHGWRLQDPIAVSRDPWTYQRFIQRSRAEFSVAKHGYVVSGSGWFSERSAAYLASGRPVVVEDTGFTSWLPVGEGIVPFRSVEEAAQGVQSVLRSNARHRVAAREIAAEYFDARRVLSDVLEACDAETRRPTRKPV
jgi:hypothetical protein